MIDNEDWFHITEDGERAYLTNYSWVRNYQERLCTVRDKKNNYFHIDLYGQKTYKSTEIYGSISAARVTKDWKINFNANANYRVQTYVLDSGTYKPENNSKAINVSDSFAFKNPSLVFVANDRVTDFNLNWDNLASPNNAGIVSGKAFFDPTQATVLLDKIKYVVEDSIWQIVKYNPIVWEI